MFSRRIKRITSYVHMSSREKPNAAAAEMQRSLSQRRTTLLSHYFLQFSWQVLFSSHKYFPNFPYIINAAKAS